MNNYKYFRLSIWSIINLIFILIYIYSILYNGEVLLCDSNESINEFVVETNQGNDSYSIHPVTGLLSRFKRKLYWHINGKKSGQFSSYHEYKDYWNSGVKQDSIWKIIKGDLIKTRYNANKDRTISLQRGNNLMSDIRTSRANNDMLRQERRNLVNSILKK